MAWRHRLLNLIRRGRLDRDIERELSFHIQERIDDLAASGMSEEEARRAARRQFGNYGLQKERTRDMNMPRWVDSIRHDVRYAIRVLKQNPGFTLTAILVLGLGIGINTAVFTVINTVFFRPLPVQNPDELVYLYWLGNNAPQPSVSYSFFKFLQDHKEAFSGLTAHSTASLRLSGEQESTMLTGEAVLSNYFDVLGVKPMLGRTFVASDDDASRSEPSIVIGYDLWTRRFDGDPNVIGRKVRLGSPVYNHIPDRPFTIIGVIGPDFRGLSGPWIRSQFWLTYAHEPHLLDLARALPGRWSADLPIGVTPVGRLKPGVTRAQAHAIVQTQGRHFAAEEPRRFRANFFPADGAFGALPAEPLRLPFDPMRSVIPERLAAVLLVITGIVLTIAASNIAGILMARGVFRTGEVSVRIALGARGHRILQQLLIESLTLAFVGGAAGLLVAAWMLRLFRLYTPERFSLDVSMDWRVLVFTAAVCVGAGLICGVGPAIQARRTDICGITTARLGASVGAIRSVP